ncbi:unnamed protein product [Amoebophrya sp. A25]|nr:unnamed protein product [Amoebophrya sp. A25]|eukprot:GSA25T00015664001.1
MSRNDVETVEASPGMFQLAPRKSRSSRASRASVEQATVEQSEFQPAKVNTTSEQVLTQDFRDYRPSGNGEQDNQEQGVGSPASGSFRGSVLGLDELDETGSVDEKAAEQALMVGGSSNFATIVNIVKNVVGAGLLTLPLTMYNGTPAITVPWVFIIGLLNFFAFYTLGVMSEGRCNTYGQLWEMTLGKKTRLIADIFLVLNGSITCMQYLVLIGDFMPNAIPQVFGETGCLKAKTYTLKRLYPILFCTLLIIFPVSLLSKLDFLKWPSFAGVAFTLYAVVYVIVDFAMRGYFGDEFYRNWWTDSSGRMAQDATNGGAWTDQRKDERGAISFPMMLSIIAIYSSSFACHYNAPKFYRELGPKRTPKQFLMISIISFVIIISIFLLFSFVAYGRFGGMMRGNVLKSYDASGNGGFMPSSLLDSVAVKIMWLGMALSVMTSYPLISNSARAAFFEIFFSFSAEQAPTWLYVLVTAVYVLISAVIGVIGPGLDLLGSMKGATTTVALCLLFPGLMLVWKVKRDVAVEQGIDEETGALLQGQDHGDAEQGEASGGASRRPSAVIREERNATPFSTAKRPGLNRALGWSLFAIAAVMSVAGIIIITLKQAGKIGREEPFELKLAASLSDAEFALAAAPGGNTQGQRYDPLGYLVKLFRRTTSRGPNGAGEFPSRKTSGVWGKACAWKHAPTGSVGARNLQTLQGAITQSGGAADLLDKACESFSAWERGA